MKKILLLFTILATLFSCTKKETFEVGEKTFLLNNEPFVVKAAELHYPRIPKEYWEHRIKAAKALGMNTICLYIFWNYHEPIEGEFDFTGQKDIAAFCKMAQENGLYVIVRPGPYVCAEWEMGGLPWWLLKKKDIKLREQDPYFMERTQIFLNKVGEQLADLQVSKGGNIIMVQVENEYGSFGTDKPYVSEIRDMVRGAGFTDVPLFQCDWNSNFENNALDDLVWTINFGTGANIDDQFRRLLELRPDTPLMCSEFWSGWFDHWGAKHETRSAEDLVNGMKEMLDRNISFSLYMTHGGTSFGHWGGANFPNFSPTCTSYDYDAPIGESGNLTPKFYAVRELLENYLPEGEKLAAIPDSIPTIAIPAFQLTQVAPLFDNLPEPKKSENIQSMEFFDQGWGSIMYSTMLEPSTEEQTLIITEAHDWTQVFIDGEKIASLSRLKGEGTVKLPPLKKAAKLDILVEAMGRMNFGKGIYDWKGITEKVEIQNRNGITELKNWEVYSFPVDYEFAKQQKYVSNEKGTDKPAYYKGTFNLDKVGDTFFDMSNWSKGLVWINGHAIGRFWEIGPQQTMYMPGCWLKEGENEIIILDIASPAKPITQGLRKPILDVQKGNGAFAHRKLGENLNLKDEKPTHQGSFKPGNGWQYVKFDNPTDTRFFCIEALNSHGNDNYAAMAELELLGEDGKPISRQHWKVIYADSEELDDANNVATNVFDLQESTFWHTNYSSSNPSYPHQLVIDLGEDKKITGFAYLPRAESNKPGMIKDYNILTKLWYDKPANLWTEALPIGNGFIGAMIFGDVDNELIQLNEGTLWSGGPQKKNVNPEASKYLKPLREALAQNDYKRATELCKKMQGNYCESFLPLGDLKIHQAYNNNNRVENYRRELDLSNALATTKFKRDGVEYLREVLTSNPDNILAIHYTASKDKMINLKISINSQLSSNVVAQKSNRLVLSGKAPARVDPNYYNKEGRAPIEQIDINGCNGMRFQSIIEAKADGGTVKTIGDTIVITDANAVTLFLSAATSFNGFDKCPDSEEKNEQAIAEDYINKAILKSYDAIKADHINDYKQYFDRVSFVLANNTMTKDVNNKLPSDMRLKLYSYGNYDPELETLFFNYGRYLLISASRPGGSAANLQGIWNKEVRPPWSSNYTVNINTQMNYWPAEVSNLSEMHEPLLQFIQNLSKTGSVTAKEYYNAKGWVVHHNTDIWGLSNAVGDSGDGDPNWANWYMGGNWLCQHLWEHYQYTGDTKYLKETAYPIMKEAALFCLDWLIEEDGYLTTAPSTSPEAAFKTDNGNYSVTTGATMDIAIIRDLFTNLIEASEILNYDKKFSEQLKKANNRLLPYQIGARGQLQEWSKDHIEEDQHHRHISHLFGLHPGRQISPLTTPELAKASERTFELRGDEGTGWSKGWKINFAARLLDGEHAYRMIREILTYVEEGSGNTGGTYPNFFDAHPPFQIDGNFGATAGMIEMLLQSHLGEIHILPALPNAWSEGEIKGIKARGNYEIDIKWSDNTLDRAIIKSNADKTGVVRTSTPIVIEDVKYKESKDGEYFLYTIEMKKGENYILNRKG